MSKPIRIFEVGPRDGLQNEAQPVSKDLKVQFIRSLRAAGLVDIEIASMVKADQVPAMKDSLEVCRDIINSHGAENFWALVPNLKGLELAVGAGITHVAFFTSASETFNQKNIHTSVKDSLEQLELLMNRAKQLKLKTRVYLSMVFGCPYEGKKVVELTFPLVEKIKNFSPDLYSFGDTIGIATPCLVKYVIDELNKLSLPMNNCAMHFHDTRGAALANVCQSLHQGITSFDSSAAGMGGCPFAKGATGNLATEDLLLLLEGEKKLMDIDSIKVSKSSLDILSTLGKKSSSKAHQFLLKQ